MSATGIALWQEKLTWSADQKRAPQGQAAGEERRGLPAGGNAVLCRSFKYQTVFQKPTR